MINFNFISYVLILIGKVLMIQFDKKFFLSIIVRISTSNCLKIVQNLLGALYTLVHLIHFPCTVNVMTLYNGANSTPPPRSCIHVGMLTMFSMVQLTKWWMTQGQIFFPKHHYCESIGIFIWELNKLSDIGVQSLCDKENKKVVQN